LGAAVGILVLSKVMNYCLGNFYVPTNFFFVGLVIGSIPLIVKKTKDAGRIRFYHALPFLFAMAAVIALAIVNTYMLEGEVVGTTLPPMSVGNAFFYFFGGMLGAASMVIPGISGSLVMVLIGLYDNVMAAISGLMEFGNTELMIRSIVSIIPMGLGIVFGIFTIAKVTELLMRKFKTATYVGITGLLIGSMAALLISMELPTLTIGTGSILVSVVTSAAGFFTAFFLGRE
jgi:putative membrane protein